MGAEKRFLREAGSGKGIKKFTKAGHRVRDITEGQEKKKTREYLQMVGVII